jgi:ribonuclease P protein component
MKKIGNAVRRNKLKRRIKSWFRENEALLPTGLKVNLIAREGAAELSWTELSSELNDLAGMLKQ